MLARLASNSRHEVTHPPAPSLPKCWDSRREPPWPAGTPVLTLPGCKPCEWPLWRLDSAGRRGGGGDSRCSAWLWAQVAGASGSPGRVQLLSRFLCLHRVPPSPASPRTARPTHEQLRGRAGTRWRRPWVRSAGKRGALPALSEGAGQGRPLGREPAAAAVPQRLDLGPAQLQTSWDSVGGRAAPLGAAAKSPHAIAEPRLQLRRSGTAAGAAGTVSPGGQGARRKGRGAHGVGAGTPPTSTGPRVGKVGSRADRDEQGLACLISNTP
ncbi:uncharacterized protein LOC134761807 [Pongo abelii]|uniref:uncharacterized protein LOC134761807 n=1 Tax=Pongo abelii TaxID=9601 RepID=UPI003005018D